MSTDKGWNSTLWRILISEYHLTINLLLLTYVLWLRIRYGESSIEGFPSLSFKSIVDGDHAVMFRRWEWQAFITFATMGAVKARKESSCIHAVAFNISLFSQLFVIFMAFLVSQPLCLTYASAFFLAFLTLHQPQPNASEKLPEVFTPTRLQQRTRGDQVKQGQATLVLFHANFSLACHHAACQFAEIAETYGSEQTVFATLDIGQWRNSPLLTRLNIDVSVASPSLPTIILWENGEEQSRLPRKHAASSGFVSRSAIIREFELDMRRARAKTTNIKN